MKSWSDYWSSSWNTIPDNFLLTGWTFLIGGSLIYLISNLLNSIPEKNSYFFKFLALGLSSLGFNNVSLSTNLHGSDMFFGNSSFSNYLFNSLHVLILLINLSILLL